MVFKVIRHTEKKHKEILTDYEDIKRRHLEKLGTIMLKNDEKFEKLKKYKSDGKFLNKI